MTGAEIVTALESIGAVVELTEAGVVNVDAPAVPELSLLVAEAKAHRAEVVAELKRHVVLVLDDAHRRRHDERRERTADALAERYCPACGFSFWRVPARGDSSCYACALLREGKPLRCARCGGEEWRRDEHGRRACSTCSGGDGEVAAPSAIAPPGRTSGDVLEGRGAG